MIERRFYTTKQIAGALGFVRDDGTPNPRAFLRWVKKIKGRSQQERRHSIIWDIKELTQCLDKRAKIEPVSVDYDKIIRERLQRGKIQDAVRC